MAIHQVAVAGAEGMEAVTGNKQLEGTTTLLNPSSHLKDKEKQKYDYHVSYFDS